MKVLIRDFDDRSELLKKLKVVSDLSLENLLIDLDDTGLIKVRPEELVE